MDTIPPATAMENPPQTPLGGLDPAELLKQGAAQDTVMDSAASNFQSPAIEDLAAIFPQFEILEFIGKGGMGAVYKVRQKDLDRIVALKILPPAIGQSPEFSMRFTREAKALAKLNHPGIVTLHEFGQAGGLYFILMEFVDGVNLAQLMKTGRISPHEALAIVPQICDALQFAHDQGIVHRDIKPENILLDRLGRVKVADFGIAKVVAAVSDPIRSGDTPVPENQTLAGKIIGTPHYMAPEQIDHPSEVDHRADIYALGVVFYQMLTGELPGNRLEAPSKKVQIDVRLDEIVMRAMEKDPELRFQHASVMKTRLKTMDSPSEKTPPNRNPFAVLGEVRDGRFVLAWPKIIICYFLIAGMTLLGATAVMALRGQHASIPSRNLITSCGIALEMIVCMVVYARSAGLGRPRWKSWLTAFRWLILPGVVVLIAIEWTRDKVGSTHDEMRDDKPPGAIAKPNPAQINQIQEQQLSPGLAPPHTESPVSIIMLPDREPSLMGEQVSEEYLNKKLRSLKQQNPDLAVVIKAEKQTPNVKITEMLDSLAGLGITKVSLITPPDQGQAEPDAGAISERAAMTDVETWLAGMDAGNYAQSWKDAAEGFHHAVAQEGWVAMSKEVRQPLGKVISRKVISTQQMSALPGIADGPCCVVKFVTSFAEMQAAVETASFVLEKDGQWKAAAYLILPAEAAKKEPALPSEKAAVAAAETWLTGIDAGNYAQSWKEAAQFFQSSITEADWSAALTSVRKPLSELKSRKLHSAKSVKSLPGAPDGDYVVMQFDTSFAAKEKSVETVTFMKDPNGTWKAVGYFIL